MQGPEAIAPALTVLPAPAGAGPPVPRRDGDRFEAGRTGWVVPWWESRTPPTAARPPRSPRRPPAASPAPLGRIREDLLIGSAAQAAHLASCRAAAVTHVINATLDEPHAHPGAFTYLRVPILDRLDAALGAHLDEVVRFDAAARAQGGRVLVHCQAGISRSGAVATALLMAREGLGRPQAQAAVCSARACVRPNPGLVAALDAWAAGRAGGAASPAATAAQRLTALLGVAAAADSAVGGPEVAAHMEALLDATAALAATPTVAEATVTDCVGRAWEAYGGSLPAHRRARGALAAWLQAARRLDVLPAPLLQAAVGRLRQPLAWCELCLDVPLAPLLWEELGRACPWAVGQA